MGFKNVDIIDYKWDGDPKKSLEEVNNLIATLKETIKNKGNKKLIIIANSWGCVLTTLALQYTDENSIPIF